MKDKIQKLLDEAIEVKIKNIANTEVGSEERTSAIDELAQLHKMRIEEAKIEVAKSDNCEERENRKEQQKSQRVERILTVVMQSCIAVGGWICYDIWNKRALRFEEHGSIGSPINRNLLSKITPKIKN